MATNYKNIVITPNIGSSTDDPKIQFSGGNTSVNTDITLKVYPSSNGTLSFEGSAGQLFSITNDLTGSIFSVNDVSGIPSIDVYADGTVELAPYGGSVGIGTTSPTSGRALTLNGSTNYYGIDFQVAGTSRGKIIQESSGNMYYDAGAALIFRSNGATERMQISAAGDVAIGSAAGATNTLRFFDVYNTDTGASAGAIQRFITSNVAGTGVTSLDLIKYKNGGAYINNNEPNAAAFTAFQVSGSEKLRISSTGITVTGAMSATSLAGTAATGSGASGTWGINVTGSAGSAATATTATNQSGGTVSATTGAFSGRITRSSTGGINSPSARFALTTAQQADVHISSSVNGSTATNTQQYGLTLSPAGGSTQAGILFSENGSDGTAIGFFCTNSYASGPFLRAFIDPAGNFSCVGNITAYSSSDIRLKTNVETIKNPLKKIQQINGIAFDWTDEEIKNRGGEDGYFVRKHDVGVIAQEVEKVLPEVVATRENGIKAVQYEKLVPLLIEAIKELSGQVDDLQNQIQELKK